MAGLWRNVPGRRYRRWTTDDGDLVDGAIEEWTEIGPDGVVLREIAFDESGKVVHLMPSDKYHHGTYGVFDLAPVEMAGIADSVDAVVFDRRWQKASGAAALLPPPPGAASRFVKWLAAKLR